MQSDLATCRFCPCLHGATSFPHATGKGAVGARNVRCFNLKTAIHHGVHGGKANIWRFSLNHLLGERSVFAKLLNYSVYSVLQLLFLGLHF